MAEILPLQCPGTRDGAVQLTNEFTTPFGIGHPYNSGECPIFVDSLDASGSVLDELQLQPGEGRDWYYPVEGATSIWVVCHSDCSGQGELTYDTPSG